MARRLQRDLLAGPGTLSPGPEKTLVHASRGGPPPARGPPTGRVFYSYLDLRARGIPYSRVHLRRMERAGQFPMHVALGAGNNVQTSIAWVASEINAWEDAKIAQRGIAPDLVSAGIADSVCDIA
jgi:prophage regulatory protein